MATFDGPARAVRCAQAFVEAVKPSGSRSARVRTPGRSRRGQRPGRDRGPRRGEVAGLAGTSEVWASSTVKDLTAGSGSRSQTPESTS